MSAYFDRSQNGGGGNFLAADGALGTPPADPFPFSVTAWVRLPDPTPNATTQYVWWYGKVGTTAFVALAYDGSTRKFRIVCGSGYGSVPAVESGQVSAAEWHLVTLVATKNPTNNLITHDLRIGQGSAISDTGAAGATAPSAFDRFAIGRHGGISTNANPGSFHVEHPCMWKTALNATQIGNMADPEKLLPPQAIGGVGSKVSHWVLSGHSRHGLDSQKAPQVPEGLQRRQNIGENLVHMLTGSLVKGPMWSVVTPALRYPYTAATPPKRPPKHRPSRRHPQFIYWRQPEFYGFPPGAHPLYDDPDAMVLAWVQYQNSGMEANWPPGFTGGARPSDYVTVVADRLADWFEYQGFFAGRGSEGQGQYEGAVHLENLCVNLIKTVPEVPPYLRDGDVGIPLEEHPLDRVGINSSGQEVGKPYDPVASFYRANGERLVREYTEVLWKELKRSLDERRQGVQSTPLCYPKRLHFDYEKGPTAEELVTGKQAPPVPDPAEYEEGNWPFHEFVNGTNGEVDARWDTEELAGAPWTAEEIWVTAPQEAHLDDYGINVYTGAGRPFLNWATPWIFAMREHALESAVTGPAKGEFPLMRWSNHRAVVANNPDWPVVTNRYFWSYTTAPVEAPQDFSAPELYGNLNFAEYLQFEGDKWGPDNAMAWRRWTRALIDACVNAPDAKPLSPWIPPVGWSAGGVYSVREGDLWWLYQYLWQRGCDEYLVFAASGAQAYETTYRVGVDLGKLVRCQGVRGRMLGRGWRTGR